MNPEILEKIAKIKALADKGTEGEKENAEEMLERLLAKYALSEEDLLEEEVTEHEFRYWGHYGDKLLSQVIYSILPEAQVFKYTYKRNCHARFVNCTMAQALQIKETFEFYRNHLDEGFKNYYRAFVQVEGIFPDKPPENDVASDTPMSSDARALAMMMNKHERLLMLED